MLGQIFEFLFHVRKKKVFLCEIFPKSPKNYNGNSHSKLPAPPGFGSRFWRFFTIFHGFSLGKIFFQALRTYIDAKFHGESISDGFRAIRERKVGQKLKNPEKMPKLDSQVTILEILSRSTPHRTVDTPCAAGARSDGLRPTSQQRISHVSDLKLRVSGWRPTPDHVTSLKTFKRCSTRCDLEGICFC